MPIEPIEEEKTAALYYSEEIEVMLAIAGEKEMESFLLGQTLVSVDMPVLSVAFQAALKMDVWRFINSYRIKTTHAPSVDTLQSHLRILDNLFYALDTSPQDWQSYWDENKKALTTFKACFPFMLQAMFETMQSQNLPLFFQIHTIIYLLPKKYQKEIQLFLNKFQKILRKYLHAKEDSALRYSQESVNCKAWGKLPEDLKKLFSSWDAIDCSVFPILMYCLEELMFKIVPKGEHLLLLDNLLVELSVLDKAIDQLKTCANPILSTEDEESHLLKVFLVDMHIFLLKSIHIKFVKEHFEKERQGLKDVFNQIAPLLSPDRITGDCVYRVRQAMLACMPQVHYCFFYNIAAYAFRKIEEVLSDIEKGGEKSFEEIFAMTYEEHKATKQPNAVAYLHFCLNKWLPRYMNLLPSEQDKILHACLPSHLFSWNPDTLAWQKCASLVLFYEWLENKMQPLLQATNIILDLRLEDFIARRYGNIFLPEYQKFLERDAEQLRAIVISNAFFESIPDTEETLSENELLEVLEENFSDATSQNGSSSDDDLNRKNEEENGLDLSCSSEDESDSVSSSSGSSRSNTLSPSSVFSRFSGASSPSQSDDVPPVLSSYSVPFTFSLAGTSV